MSNHEIYDNPLRLSQRSPEPAPGRKLDLGRPEASHLPAGVAADQRVVVDLVITHKRTRLSGSHIKNMNMQESINNQDGNLHCAESLIGVGAGGTSIRAQIPPRACALLTRVMAR